MSLQTETSTAPLPDSILRRHHARNRRHARTNAGLAALVTGLVLLTLMAGERWYGPGTVLAVLGGDQIPGASFTIGELRLPRVVLGVLAGAAFGLAGVIYQTLLRNSLTSPDIIGVSGGASAAAVFALVVLHWSGAAVSLLALAGAVATALAAYFLAARGGVVPTRIILIGLGLAAMLQSVIAYLLSRAPQWDIQSALQWMTGSLNAASWERIGPLALVTIVLIPLLLARGNDLGMLRLGDDTATALGVRTNSTRLILLFGATVLLATATAATGPIAFVAFMAGPIAGRITVPGSNLLVPAMLVGAALVLGGDLVGQVVLPDRMPVGVVTGAIGAPFLLALLVRAQRQGNLR